MSHLIGELYAITTYDGVVYQLSDGEGRFVVQTLDNAGLPPVDYQTRRPYKSDKVIETGFRLSPRSFSVAYQFIQKCSREAYWQARSLLLEATRPNRNGALTLIIILSDGTKRAIVARAITPVFPSVDVDEVNEWNISEILQFEAFDPTWFDPNYTSHLILGTTLGELTFPIAFDDDNIFFGAGSVFGTLVIPYTGTFYAYPVIRVTPPYNSVRVSHANLNVSIQVLRNSSVNDLIIDLENGTITDSAGNDLSGYLTPDSDLLGFKIEVNPIVPNGNNSIVITIPGYTIPNTTVLVSYRTRYIGI